MHSTVNRVGLALRKTLAQAVPTLLGIVVLNFLLLQMLPGDAVDVMAAESGAATQEGLAQLRRHLGLDVSLWEQLWRYLSGLLRFDLGDSLRHNMPVTTLIGMRLGASLLLMLTALSAAFLMGVLLGFIMATYAGSWLDRVLSVVSLVLYSTPSFWLGLMAIVFFAVQLGWFPSGGNVSIGAGLTGWAYVADMMQHLILPALTMSGFYMAIFARLTRTAMLEHSRQDYVRTAQAKGLGFFTVQIRHILRNALIPVTTVAGMHFGTLLGGAVVIEVVFSWPGLGRLALESVMARDYSVLMGILFFSSILVLIANIGVDLLHAWLDPRIDSR